MLLQTGAKRARDTIPEDPLLSPCEGEARYVLRLAFPLVRRLLVATDVSRVIG